MKFAPNHLYIEEYVKCANCGVLIYDERGKKQSQPIIRDGKRYCSQWCLDWEQARRRHRSRAGDSSERTLSRFRTATSNLPTDPWK